jgi:monoamine oxidase
MPAILTHTFDHGCSHYSEQFTTPSFRPDDPGLLARPVGPLHFAGEHTAGPWSGLMEGALRSGHRAAAELLATRPGTS